MTHPINPPTKTKAAIFGPMIHPTPNSAGDVAVYADKIVIFDDSDFDISPDSIRFVDGKWAFADTLNKRANGKGCG